VLPQVRSGAGLFIIGEREPRLMLLVVGMRWRNPRAVAELDLSRGREGPLAGKARIGSGLQVRASLSRPH
jgi:hypothetical protein